MPTHADMAAKLLYDAAAFFRTLADQNAPIKEQMTQNASVFDQMAELVVTKPTEQLDGKTYAELGARLLMDAATFFRTLAQQNPPIAKQMSENAFVYEKIAERVQKDPGGIFN